MHLELAARPSSRSAAASRSAAGATSCSRLLLAAATTAAVGRIAGRRASGAGRRAAALGTALLALSASRSLAATSTADLVVLGFSTLILGGHCDVFMRILNGRQFASSFVVSRKLHDQFSIVVDANPLGAVHLVPSKRQSFTSTLDDARLNSALGIDACLTAVGSVRLLSTSRNCSHGDANSLSLQIGDANLVVLSAHFKNTIVIMRTTFALRRASALAARAARLFKNNLSLALSARLAARRRRTRAGASSATTSDDRLIMMAR